MKGGSVRRDVRSSQQRRAGGLHPVDVVVETVEGFGHGDLHHVHVGVLFDQVVEDGLGAPDHRCRKVPMGRWHPLLQGGGGAFGATRALLPVWGRVIVFVVMLALIAVLVVLLIRLRRGKPENETGSHLLQELLASDLLSEEGPSEKWLSELEPQIKENCPERVVELFMTFRRECRKFRDGSASLYELAEAVRRDPFGPEAAQMPSCAVKVVELKKGMEAAAMALAAQCRRELRQDRGARKLPS